MFFQICIHNLSVTYLSRDIMSDLSHPTDQFEGKLLDERYQIGEYATGGSFGSIHFGVDRRTGGGVAIKFEPKEAQHPQLILELSFYKTLNARDKSIQFMPKVHHFGPIDDYNAMVMEKLGPSLLAMMRLCDGSFSIATTTQVIFQLFNIIEYEHERKLLYRDVKPENFLIGLPNTDKWCTVCLIDLGFCKSYLTDDYEHIPEITNKPVAGTIRYMSISNHEGREVARRDDLEALLYMAVYMFKHKLPWDDIQECKQSERGKMICEIKKQTTPEQLFVDMPPQYGEIMTEVEKLQFEERPPYRRLMGMLADVLTWLEISLQEQFYDWDRSHNPIPESLRM